ncbi:sterol desaturase family protein [uncultured Roseovarius sp.]|uniref:sterol desaturase family protein n=1 Tax=uncultured Roseovarius sp. TaxID=293344 RepID=UPI002624632D|nr:sterol desaturase family protein [uncultured Roseovarius sp.]
MPELGYSNLIMGSLAHDFFRYVIGAGGVYLVVNVLLAPWLAARKIRSEMPGWPQIRREIIVSLRTVVIFASVGLAICLLAATGILPVYDRIETYGWGWFWASAALIILAHDAWFYWAHWLMHRMRALRRMHLLHHQSHNPTAFTSYAFDMSEALVHAIFLPLFLAVVPMHPAAILIFTSHMMLRNAVGHCGVEVFPGSARGKPLFDWMTTVTHHDLHHAQAGYNYGLYFTWWDRWMGTEHPKYLEAFQWAAGMPVSGAVYVKK